MRSSYHPCDAAHVCPGELEIQKRGAMATSFSAIVTTVAILVFVLVVVLVVLRITLGAGRYGRGYDHEVRRLQTRVADRPEAEARNESDSESTT